MVNETSNRVFHDKIEVTFLKSLNLHQTSFGMELRLIKLDKKLILINYIQQHQLAFNYKNNAQYYLYQSNT